MEEDKTIRYYTWHVNTQDKEKVFNQHIQAYVNALKQVYFDCSMDGMSVETFKKYYLEFTSNVIDHIDDKYADHVEGVFNDQ